MSKLEKNIDLDFYNKIAELLKNARKTVVQTVNKTMVYTYFEVGKIIVEEEQKIIDKLEHFLLELGKGFTFVGRQVRFTFGDFTYF